MAPTDKELVARCQSDRAAFEELVRRYRRPIFAYARAMLGSPEDAEEVAQDVLVKVYRAAHRFNPRYSFKTWLYTIVSNTCKNKWRGRRPHGLSLDDERAASPAADAEPDPLEAYRRAVETAEVRNAISQLSPGYREVLYLRYVEGLRYREIAGVLGVSIGNVEARIFRGKRKIRRILLAGRREGRAYRERGSEEL